MPPSREPGKALRLVPTVALSSVPVKQSHYTTGNLTFALTPLKLSLTWGTLHSGLFLLSQDLKGSQSGAQNDYYVCTYKLLSIV